MNKLKLIFLFTILLFIIVSPSIANPDDEESDNTTTIAGVEVYTDRVYVQDSTNNLKAICFDVGYGFDGISGGMAIRYWNIAIGIGATGMLAPSKDFAYSAPIGERFSQSEPLPEGYYADNAPGQGVYIDASYYLPYLEPFTIFATVGFYAQQDTLIAVSYDSGNAFYRGGTTKSGPTFGGGIEYYNSQWIRTAFGYHSKRGFFFRLAYTWR